MVCTFSILMLPLGTWKWICFHSGKHVDLAPQLCSSCGDAETKWYWKSMPKLRNGGYNFQNLNSWTVESYWEKAMAPCSSTLAWKIPWTEEPGGLQSMGSRRVRHDWVTSLSLFTFMHWRRKWQPTPVFLPGESQGRGSLVGCRLWGRTESDTTEVT